MRSLILKAAAGFLFLMFSLALVLFLPAGPLAFWQAWLFLAVFGTCTVHHRLLAEERFLRASLPGYAEYCGRVRYRLVPYVW